MRDLNSCPAKRERLQSKSKHYCQQPGENKSITHTGCLVSRHMRDVNPCTEKGAQPRYKSTVDTGGWTTQSTLWLFCVQRKRETRDNVGEARQGPEGLQGYCGMGRGKMQV